MSLLSLIATAKARIYDFTGGNRIKSADVDQELNQLVGANNDIIVDLTAINNKLNTVDGQIAGGGSDLTTHKTSSDHDGRYYTEAEIDALLNTLRGAGWTTESLKGLADVIATHKTSSDHDGRYYTETEMNALLTAMRGAGWTTETLKGLADALATHKTSSDHDGRYYTEAEIDAMDAGNVKKTGAQTISSEKNFTVSPTVPTPTSPTHTANKAFVESYVLGQQPINIENDSVPEQKMAPDMKKQAGGVAPYDDLTALTDLITKQTTAVVTLDQTGTIESVADSSEGAVPNAVIHGCSLVQSLENGDFSDGTDGWTPAYSTAVVVDGVYKDTATGVANNPYMWNSAPFKENLTSGLRIFSSALVRVTNSECTNLSGGVKYGNSGYAGVLSGVNSISSPIANKWYRLAMVTEFKDTDVYWSQNSLKMLHQHLYADSATANGKVMEVKDVVVFEMGEDSSNPHYNYTADQMSALVGNDYFEGLKSVETVELSSRGVNLFDGKLHVEGAYSRSDVIKVDATKGAILTNNHYESLAVYDYSDGSDVLIGSVAPGLTRTVAVGVTAIRVGRSLPSSLDISACMLNNGLVPLPYQPFDGSKLTIDVSGQPLHKVPNGAENTLTYGDGRFAYRKEVNHTTLTAPEITALTTTGVNVDVVSITKKSDYKYVGTAVDIIGSAMFDNYPEKSYVDSLDNINTYARNFSSLNWAICVAKGTYATLAEAQADLAGTEVIYQLATPEVIDQDDFAINGIDVDGILTSNDSVTEFYADKYNILPVSELTYPVSLLAGITGLKNALEYAETSAEENFNLVNDKIANSGAIDLVRAHGNTKMVDDGTSVAGMVGTVISELDTVNYKVNGKAIKLKASSSGVANYRSERNGLSYDLSKLNNGSPSIGDDMFPLAVFISSITNVSQIIIGLGSDATFGANSANLTVLASALQTGWNYLNAKKSDFVVAGTFSWENVQSYRYHWVSTASATTSDYVTFQGIQLVKADPSGLYPNPLADQDCTINDGEWFVGYESGEIVIKELSKSVLSPGALVFNNKFSDFVINAIRKVNVANEDTYVTWYIDSNNYITALTAGGTTRLRKSVAGVVTTETEPLTVVAGEVLNYKIKKDGKSATLYVTKNNGEAVTVSLDVSEFSSSFGNLAIGCASASNSLTLATSITQLPHADTANKAFVADEVNSKSRAMIPKQLGGGLLINGNFDVWQRGTAFSLSVGEYTADRWIAYFSSGGFINRVMNDNPLITAKYALEMDLNGSASVIYQKIENPNNIINGKRVTLSFWAKSDKPLTMSVQLAYTTYTSSIESYTVSVGTSWKKITVVFENNRNWTADEIAIITIGRVFSDITATLLYSQVKVELGNVPTEFIPKTYAEELRDCKRYFQAFGGEAYTYLANGFGSASNTMLATLYLQEEMRTPPTITAIYALGVFDGTTTRPATGVSLRTADKNSVAINVNVASGLVVGQGYSFVANGDANSRVYLDAEL